MVCGESVKIKKGGLEVRDVELMAHPWTKSRPSLQQSSRSSSPQTTVREAAPLTAKKFLFNGDRQEVKQRPATLNKTLPFSMATRRGEMPSSTRCSMSAPAAASSSTHSARPGRVRSWGRMSGRVQRTTEIPRAVVGRSQNPARSQSELEN